MKEKERAISKLRRMLRGHFKIVLSLVGIVKSRLSWKGFWLLFRGRMKRWDTFRG